MNNFQENGWSEELVFTVHPASKRPVKTALVLMVIGMIIGGIYQFTGDTVYAAIAFAVFLVTLAPYFLKTTIMIDARGVTRKRAGIQRFMSWQMIRRLEPSRNGIYISAKRTVSWMDFRGIYILFDNNREAVVGKIRENMGQREGVTAPRV